MGRAARELEVAVATSTDPHELYDALPGHLQRLMGCGPVFLATVDPTTLHFTGELRRDISDEAAAAFLAHEIGVDDVVKFQALAGAADPVETLFHATDHRPDTSARWRDVIAPQGWGDELRAAVRESGWTWAFLCLHRDGGDSPYDAGDADALRQVMPVLAGALRRAAIAGRGQQRPTSLEPGVVVLDADFVVTSMTGAAAEWLDLLGGSATGMPLVVMSVAAQAITTSRPQLVRVLTGDGCWVSIHASALHGDGLDSVAVILEPAHPADALPALAAAARLTPRESEVAAAVLRGLSDRVIARALAISEYTVQDHLKSIYAKTGTRGRSELVAKLLTR